jgi:hypothetical protein
VRLITAEPKWWANTRLVVAQYLLVLHGLDESPELIASARALAVSDPAAEFVLLVPATAQSPLDALLRPYRTSTQIARERAQSMRAGMLAARLPLVATRLGKPTLLQALDDALRFTDYAAVLIASPDHPILHRLRRDLPCRAAARFPRTRVIHAAGGRSSSGAAPLHSGSAIPSDP